MKKLSNFEKAVEIREEILKYAAFELELKMEGRKLRKSRLSFVLDRLSGWKREYEIDPAGFSKKEAVCLGFQESAKDDEMFIPIWLCLFLVPEFTAISLDGKKRVIRSSKIDIYKDIHRGCVPLRVKLLKSE